MSTATQEIIRACESLPPDKQVEVADFARFLLAQQGDDAWEKLLADTKPRPKLEMFFRESAAEGDEPMDLTRMNTDSNAISHAVTAPELNRGTRSNTYSP